MDTLLQQAANGIVLTAAYALVTLGLFLVFNALHVPNFAHGEMFAIGGYFQYLLVVTIGLPFLAAIPVAVCMVAIVGIVTERVVFRRLEGKSNLAVLVASLALAIIIQEVIALIWGQDAIGVPSPIQGVVEIGGVRIATYRLVVIAIVLVACAALAVAVYRTTYGRSLRAIAQNREIAELAGINVRTTTIVTFGLSAGLAGLAGAILAPTATLTPHMGFHPTLVAFCILVVIGGGGGLSAVLIASCAVALTETFTAAYISNTTRTAVVFVVLVLFLIARPEGARRPPSGVRARL